MQVKVGDLLRVKSTADIDPTDLDERYGLRVGDVVLVTKVSTGDHIDILTLRSGLQHTYIYTGWEGWEKVDAS